MARTKLDNYLRTYRKRSGLSQDEVAYLLGSREGTKVSRYERNGRIPSLDTALAYQAIFGISAEDLFAGRLQKAERVVMRRARYLADKIARSQNPQDRRKLEALAAIRRTRETQDHAV